MSNAAKPAETYLRFLQLAAAIRSLPSLPALDPLEERLLNLIACANQRNERLSVRDIMAKDDLGSPATIHSRLKAMRKGGWIMLTDTEDSRRKQIELTNEAFRHFEKLSKCMVRAVRGA